MSAIILTWLTFAPALDSPTSFRLELVKTLKCGATNVAVFRLTALHKHNYVLPTAGSFSLPSAYDDKQWWFTAADPPPLSLWTWQRQAPPAKCATNFVPTRFQSEMEFAVVAPTNPVWRLNVQPIWPLSRTAVLHSKGYRAWVNLKSGNLAAIGKIWNEPWNVSENYFQWSKPITNRISFSQ